jgi:hypothetical protein
MRRISGGSDAAQVRALITDAALCVRCLLEKVGVRSETQVYALLGSVARTARVRVGPGRCDACREQKATFSVSEKGRREGPDVIPR